MSRLSPGLVGLTAVLPFLCLGTARASWTAHADFSACPSQYLSGSGSEGNFDSQSACEDRINDVMSTPGNPACARYWCTDDGGDTDGGQGSSSSAPQSLRQESSEAIAHGIVYGDAQSVGMGILGLEANAFLQGNAQSSSEEAQEQQEEAAREAQEAAEEQAREAAARKRFQDQKQAALGDLKGADAGGDGDADALKDVPTAPVPQARLTPMGDPLHPASQPGDTAPPRFFGSWNQARAACLPSETEALDHDSGKVVACPQGFPYYASGECYSEDAFEGLRVPASVLKTDHQFSADGPGNPASELKP